ncbi:hypothetical protein SAMN05444166_0986 [Singulisphaera sp. GP187]|uniref:hypothetical protein n=1 Tax=Singulisphaera sp. GP187 TaxID=1882752 RepID=UPI00092B3442|nr:hypothetical protein [Singulisphaera sp. GP187]SIN80705.1 hypothetical protein SAMN05444166_0986 [Singulisphaera sp. GP187]
MSTRFFCWKGLQVGVERSRQVLRLEMESRASWHEIRSGAGGGRRRKGESEGESEVEVIGLDVEERFEAPLYPSIANLPDDLPFVSAAVLAQKAKAVDDGIVATLEFLLDEGTMTVRGRSALLAGLQNQLQGEWDRSPDDSRLAETLGLLSAVRSLAGDNDPADSTTWPTPLRLRRNQYLRDFRRMEEVDVPLGVYSWSQRLAGLYRQSKSLQEPLSNDVAGLLKHALEADDSVRAAYEIHLALLALTNPLVRPDLLSWSRSPDESQPAPAFFPASKSREGQLVKLLVGDQPVPPDFDLIGELIARVTDGRLSLAVTEESGWYDYILNALEPLLVPDHVPEASRLELAEDYRIDLQQLFRSLLGTARESHVKQWEMAAAGACPFVISPHLTLEPLADHYRRRAESYRFVRERLVALLGENALLSWNRATPGGETGVPLLDEIHLMEQLFAGAAAIVQDELGIDPEPATETGDRRWLTAAKAKARSWIASHRDDPDLREDVRMMVPLFKDIEREEFHVLAVVGYEQRNLKVGFVERPDVTVRDGQGRMVELEIQWSDAIYPLARPVTMTCRTKRLLDRSEFRELCDREITMAAIRSALEG